MAQVDLSNYKALYFQTAKEYVNSLLAGCDKLINNLQDKDAINQIHIASHSLKSQSQVMGYGDIANICLNIEKISNDALQGVVQLSNEAILNIKKEVEKLNEMLDKPA